MKIVMPRGDIRNVSFSVNNSEGEDSGIVFDEIFFTVKKYHTDKNYVIQKKLTNGDIYRNSDGSYEFRLEPSDTDNLWIGSYEFDIEIIRESDIKQTFVGTLELTKEITWAENEE